MTANSPQTRKAKGREAAQLVRDMILSHIPELQPDDVVVKSSGVKGEDLYLSPLARKKFPYCVEIKHCERTNIWEFLEQAKSHSITTGYPPLLIFKRNRSNFFVCMPFISFLSQHGTV